MRVQDELQRTQFLLSEDSLLHSAEYRSRLEVLQELNYVDASGTCKPRLFQSRFRKEKYLSIHF